MFGLEADTVEYGEWKSGRRSEGATYPLNDEKFKQIRDETEARKLATLRAHHESSRT